MNNDEINRIINEYIRDNLSPKQEQRDYISNKYDELRGFLKGSCFQAGSYARYTANDPVHDLDVIHPVKDTTIQDEPSLVIDALYATLEEGYANSETKIKSISRQSHSVTVVFGDAPEDFSIDVVPAIEQPGELNEYGEPLYLVPEILDLNKHNREIRYEESNQNPIGWIKTDPRGYIKAASDLNEANSDFRHSAKFLKAWRHACKIEYGDEFTLKSFHLEQIIFKIFTETPDIITIDAITESLAVLPDHVSEAQIEDRADPDRYIDEYVNEITQEQKQLILRLQAEAYEIVRKLPGCQTEQEIIDCLKKLLSVGEKKTYSFIPPVVPPIVPRQPWGYKK